jgi:hypothetical protein
MSTRPHYCCRHCGVLLPGWLPVLKRPNGALLLGHLGQAHRDQVGAYLARMGGDDDIGEIAAEAYELVELDDAADQP